MSKILTALLLLSTGLFGCAAVDKADLAAWPGQSVVALEDHPFFATLPVVKTRTSDGTELRRYVGGAYLGDCLGGGRDARRLVDFSTYSEVTDCLTRRSSCSHIFAVRDGRVARYEIYATGGAVCRTNESMRPRSGASTPAPR